MNKSHINPPSHTIISSANALIGRGGRLRKRGGQVVSFAPQMLDLCAGASRFALSGLLVLGGTLAATPDAMAGTCTNVAPIICSGAADADGEDTPISIVEPGDLSVTTDPDFGLDTSDTAAPAITLEGNNVTFTDNNASSVTAQQTALQIQNNAGSATVTATGSLTGGNGGVGSGLAVTNAVGSRDITINVNNVQGQSHGIQATNNGLGNTSITATGTVTSVGATGVLVTTALTSDEVSVSVVNVNAGNTGISVTNDGDGPTTITATGAVSSVNSDAIAVSQGNYGDAVTISAVDLNAGRDGIRVFNNGEDALNIDVTGTINADERGINAFAGVDSTDVAINVNTINSVDEAVQLVSIGTGDIVINSTGALTSTDAAAIAVSANSTTSSGDLTITTSGTVSGAAGIAAYQNGNGAISISSSESVTATSNNGIFAFTAGDGGIEINAVDVSADAAGIFAVNYGDGSVAISSTGTITSDNQNGVTALSFGNGNTIIDAVDVNADQGAIVAIQAAGNVEITSTGTLSADVGVYVQTGPTSDSVSIDVNNVDSDYAGVLVNHQGTGVIEITASGDIAASGITGIGDGISVYASANSTGPVTISANNITADHAGILVDSYGSGQITVTTSGLIQTSNDDAIHIISDGAPVEVNANNIDAGGDGIRVDQYGDGDVVITATGTITAGSDGIDVNTDFGTNANIIISANIIDAGDHGIEIDSDGNGDITISAATITAADNGIDIDQNGDGIIGINVDTINAGDYGIHLDSNGDGNVTITANTITSDYAGIYIEQSGDGNIDIQVGSITSNEDGILIDQYGSGDIDITSTGTITAGYDGIDINAGLYAGNITIAANNITADDNGIEIDNGGYGTVDITVSGVVEGSNAAIYAESSYGRTTSIQNDGTLRNSDLLSTSLAITVNGGPADITNNGLITGSIITDGLDDIFVNNGTWNNVGGTSDFGGGNDLLTNSSTGIIRGANDAATAEVTTIVGLADLQNNGLITLADGAAGDLFTTDGNAAFSATSTLRVDVSGAGNSDLFVAAGDVVLSGGALDVNLIGALPTIGTQYTVLEGDTVTGQFNFADKYYTAFLGLRDSYTADSVVLDFIQLRALSAAGLTPNQVATADALDSLPLSNTMLTSVLYLGSDAAAQSAFDQLSGDIHPGARTALAEDSRLPRNAVLERLSNPEGGAVWGQLFWNTGDSDGNRNTAPIKRETWGFIAGADVGLGENAVIGVSGAYLSNDLDQRQRTSDGKLETIHVLGYVGAQAGAFRVKAGVGYAWGDIETTRNVSFTGFSDKLTAEYDATLFQAFAEASVQLPIGGGYIEPMAQVAFLRAKTDGFTEVGGLAALTAQREVEKSTISTIGARFSTSQSGNFSVGGLVGWQHSYGSLDPQTRFNFAGSDSFSIAGVPQSRDAGVANIEARFQLSPGSSIGLGYDGVLGTASQDHAAKLSFRFAF